MQIQCLISKNSWVDDYYKNLIKIKFSTFSKKISFFNNHKKLRKNYDINLIFSYFKKIPSKYLKFSKFNLVIHGSNLPYGRGMSPISWQILKGKTKIVFTLFEANKEYDRGKYYLKKTINFGNKSLLNEIKMKQFNEMINLYLSFLKNHKKIKIKNQTGKSSYFRLRKSKDSKININKSIKEQFNLLRIVDNKKYPAYFIYKNKKFKIKITDYEKNNSK